MYRYNPTFANPEWSEASQRVLILRLSSFADVERSTPHLFLAADVRAADRAAYIDMAFLPGREDSRELSAAGLPLLLGTQSHRGPGDFDLILVSNSYLLELVNLPWLLARSGVPLWAGKRDERWPPVILGGSNASAAHAIVAENGDCMADAIFFGEGEGAVGTMALAFRRLARIPRGERVKAVAAEVNGLWPAGDLEGRTRRARRDPAAPASDGRPAPVLPGPEAGTARLSITLGCPCLCSFCFEGHDRKPYREIPAAALIEAARTLKKNTGSDTLELASFTFNAHSGLAELLLVLHRLFYGVSLMSQRVDILARTPGLLELEIAADKRSFTLGIEGISARMRGFFHKSLDDHDISAALEKIHHQRTRELKLFYILSGREEETDFAEFAGFVKGLKELRRRAEAAPRLVFSFGLLVRMPFTPLRHDPPVLSEQAWRPVIGRAKSICETNGFEFRLSQAWADYAATQALALGGSSLYRLLLAIAARGCVTGDGLPQGAEKDVVDWIAGHAAELLSEKPAAHAFAFSFLETGNSRRALYAQYLRAREGRDSGYRGGGRDHQDGRTGHESARALAEITRRKHGLKPLFVKARLPREAAGMGREWGDAWMMRRFIELRPDQLENVLTVRESVVEPSGVLGPDTPWYGWTVVAVTAWDRGSLEQAVAGVPELFGETLTLFVPGSFASLELSLDLPGHVFADPVDRLSEFLRDAHSPVTVTRSGGDLVLVPARKSARKGLVVDARGRLIEGGWKLELQAGPKLRLGDFLGSFSGTGAASRATVEVRSVS